MVIKYIIRKYIMDFSNIKLVGLDLDGTLLHEDKSISDRTKLALSRVAKKGIEIVPITGRPLAGIFDEVKNLDFIRYIIYSNGSQILDGDKSLFSFAISNAVAIDVVSRLRQHDCMFEVFIDGWGYIEPDVDVHYHTAFDEESPVGKYVFGSRRVVDSIDALLSSGYDVDEIFVICKSSEIRSEILDDIKDVSGVERWCLGDNFFEMTKNGSNKGEALTVLCDYLGIDLADTMAFGDGENDLTFLQRAGVAVVMQNAGDVVKNFADIITLSNDDDGVAYILEQI